MLGIAIALLASLNPVFAQTLDTKGAGYSVDRPYLSFPYEGGKDFRCFLDEKGRLILDDNFWDVGPYGGEEELWGRINVRLQDGPSHDAAAWQRGFQNKRVFRDTAGGEWAIIQAVPWQGPSKTVVCDSPGLVGTVLRQKPPCYYLVPHGDFAGYGLNWKDSQAPPLSPLTKADLAKAEQQRQQERDARFSAKANQINQMVNDMPTTPN